MRFRLLFLALSATFFSHAYNPLLTIVLMVKNEAPVIRETLQPFIDAGIDSYFIFDTGSTDDTITITEAFFKQHNISNAIIIQEPFVDFATSRNRALDLADELFEDGCFILMPDAEWYTKNVEHLIQFCEEQKDAPCPAYLVRIIGTNIDFYIPRLLRIKSKLRFSGVVHAQIQTKTHTRAPKDIFFHWNPSRYGVQKSKRKWVRDRELLLKEYEKNPNNTRTVFYLAQTYESLGDWENACKWYEMRVNMDGWNEENFMALYKLAKAYEQLKNWEKALYYYLEASACRPHRAEPLIRVANHYWKTGNKELCFLFARRACEIPYPETDSLFIEKTLYEFTRYDLLGRSAWYVGAYNIGEQAAQEALKAHPNVGYLKTNLDCYKDYKGKN